MNIFRACFVIWNWAKISTLHSNSIWTIWPTLLITKLTSQFRCSAWLIGLLTKPWRSIFQVNKNYFSINFQKKKLSKSINLGDHYLSKTFFSKLNFWTTLLSKIMPNFWQTVITRKNFLKIFPWWHVDSWPKTLLFRTHHL